MACLLTMNIQGTPAYVNLLFEAGARLDLRDRFRYSAAGFLCRYSNNAVLLKALYEHGLDLNTVESGYTFLIITVRHGNWEIVKMLFSLGFSDVQAIDENSGKTVLEFLTDGESKNKLWAS